jgi:hypothetical protein
MDTTYAKGTKVTFTDKEGVDCSGVVDFHRRGWVLIDLDVGKETPQGWVASKMMLKASDVKKL